jgi:hypothetical protein
MGMTHLRRADVNAAGAAKVPDGSAHVLIGQMRPSDWKAL